MNNKEKGAAVILALIYREYYKVTATPPKQAANSL
jgi:hypothetical protein